MKNITFPRQTTKNTMTPIEYFLSNRSLKDLIYRKAGQNADDFYQDMCILIIKGNQQFFNDLLARDPNELGKWFNTIITKQIKLTKSAYNRTYEKRPDWKKYITEFDYNHMEYDLEEDETIDKKAGVVTDFMNSPKNLSEWAENCVVMKYVEAGSCQKASDLMGGYKSKDAVKHCISKFRLRINAHFENRDIYNKPNSNDQE